MTDILTQLAPLAAAGAFLPTWTSQVILLLVTDRGLPNALAFVFGNVFCRLTIGLGALWLFGADYVGRTLGAMQDLPVWVNVAFGVILLLLGVLLIVNRPRGAEVGETPTPRWLQAIEALPPWLAFVWGFVNVAMPGAQWIFFLSALGVIATSGANAVGQAALVVAFASVLQVMLVAPIVVYVLFQEQAEGALARARDWLACYGNVVVGVILLGFGGVTLLRAAGVM